jgi:hypothetical protein
MGQRDYWTGTPDVTDGHDVVRACGGMDDITGCCPHMYCVDSIHLGCSNKTNMSSSYELLILLKNSD